MDITNEFKPRASGKEVVPTTSMSQLATTSKWSRHVLQGSVRSSGDAEVDQTIHEVTLQERDKGWLTGPHSLAELDSIHGPLWLASRRFGVIQGTKADGSRKIRPCDDFSEFLINATTGTTEKIEPGGIDMIMAVAKLISSAVKDELSGFPMDAVDISKELFMPTGRSRRPGAW